MRKKILLSLIILFVVALAALCYTGCRGKQGEKGNDGIYLTGAFIDGGELYIALSDDILLNCGKVVGTDGVNGINGIDGIDGLDGLGIEKIEPKTDGSFVIVFTDGSQQTVTIEPKTCNHEFPDEWTTVSEATCTDWGHEYRTCSLCGYLQHRVTAPHSHDWDMRGASVITHESCSDSGWQLVTCKICGEAKVIEIEPSDHYYEVKFNLEENDFIYSCKYCGQRKPSDGIEYGDMDPSNMTCKVMSLAGCTSSDVVIADAVYCEINNFSGFYKVTSFKGNLFDSLTVDMTSLYLPSTISRIDMLTSARLFSGEHCKDLSRITIHPDNKTFRSDGNCIVEIATKTVVAGCVASAIPSDGSVTTIGSYAFAGLTDIKDIIIPSCVVTLSRYAFSETSLTELDLGGSLKEIGEGCFNNCVALETVTLTGVSSIAQKAFMGCINLSEVTLNKGIGTIAQYAFAGCTSLTTVHLASSVMRIGAWAFACCGALTDFRFAGSESYWRGTNGLGVVEEELWHESTAVLFLYYKVDTPITNADVKFGQF